MRRRIVVMMACALPVMPVPAQTPLSRAGAIQAALDRGGRIAVAAADTTLARAAVITARARPNPSATAAYSKSVPNYHLNFDIPIDFPALRTLRVRAAQLGMQAASLRFQFTRAMLAMEADTAYTRGLAALERVGLSRRTALDADSLLHMVERRRDAGDASDMDVELARLNAGQQTNVATGDSLTMISALLDLQAALGITAERVTVSLTDSLVAPPAADNPAARSLEEVAAGMSVDAASMNAQLQRRSVWSQFSVSAGIETGDPDQSGLLPTFGLGIGLPLFDRNRGSIARADAERAKAQAELALVQLETRNALAHALRERENALAKVARDRVLVASANRLVAMSLTAYREGASSLPNVLEAQRSAREILAQYIDDLAAAWVATAELRVFSLVPSQNP